jgi:hypothetical protein
MSNPAAAGTAILSPNATPGGNTVAPGGSTALPFGVVIPHAFPDPANFRLPVTGVPTFDGTPIISSLIHRAPGASDHSRPLPIATLPPISLPPVPSFTIPPGLRQLPRGLRDRAAAALPEGMTQRLARFTNKSPITRAKHG